MSRAEEVKLLKENGCSITDEITGEKVDPD